MGATCRALGEAGETLGPYAFGELPGNLTTRRSRFQISTSAPFAVRSANLLVVSKFRNFRNANKVTVRADGENAILWHLCSPCLQAGVPGTLSHRRLTDRVSVIALQYALFPCGTVQNGSLCRTAGK
jgi:hypothetical protein